MAVSAIEHLTSGRTHAIIGTNKIEDPTTGQSIMLRTALLTISLMSTVALWAQETPTTTFSLDHVALSVTDVDKSADFYKAVFGLKEITDRAEIEGVRWLSLGRGKELHILSIVEGNVEINMAVHIGLMTPNFDRFLATIEGMNLEYTGWLGTDREVTVRADGTRQLYFQDPDGYWIEVISAAAD